MSNGFEYDDIIKEAIERSRQERDESHEDETNRRVMSALGKLERAKDLLFRRENPDIFEPRIDVASKKNNYDFQVEIRKNISTVKNDSDRILDGSDQTSKCLRVQLSKGEVIEKFKLDISSESKFLETIFGLAIQERISFFLHLESLVIKSGGTTKEQKNALSSALCPEGYSVRESRIWITSVTSRKGQQKGFEKRINNFANILGVDFPENTEVVDAELIKGKISNIIDNFALDITSAKNFVHTVWKISMTERRKDFYKALYEISEMQGLTEGTKQLKKGLVNALDTGAVSERSMNRYLDKIFDDSKEIKLSPQTILGRIDGFTKILGLDFLCSS